MKHYTDFLKEHDFIRWQLLSDESLEKYWQHYRREHPESEKELRRAIKFLKNEGLNQCAFDETRRALLLERIKKTIRKREKRKQLKLIWFSVSAVAFLMMGLTLYYVQQKEAISRASKGLIVGKLLQSEDIQLITSSDTISFPGSIDVNLGKRGKAEILEKERQIQEVEVVQDQPNRLIVPYGKRSSITMADGSRVWLNSGTIVEFPAQFTGKKREIRLISGEMYIEVSENPQKPFYVETSSFNVRVYGTKFSITNYAGAPHTVVLAEGNVSLRSREEKEFFLFPGEKAVYSGDNTFSRQKVDVNQFISWKDGYLSFQNTSMTEVLQLIERYYNVLFNYDKEGTLKELTCSGKIILSENLDNVMTTIAAITDTQYRRDHNLIYITDTNKKN
ncbi:MAG: FecR domain-containing protein [Proteiniphilum sp.]|nr:FecR domain-containing protein [Proteiniphilum sp.]